MGPLPWRVLGEVWWGVVGVSQIGKKEAGMVAGLRAPRFWRDSPKGPRVVWKNSTRTRDRHTGSGRQACGLVCL